MDELKEALEVALQDVQNLEEVAELARGELEDYKRRIPDELENARQQARAGLPSQDAGTPYFLSIYINKKLFLDLLEFWAPPFKTLLEKIRLVPVPLGLIFASLVVLQQNKVL